MGPTDNFLLTLVLGSRGKSLKSRFEPQGLLLVKPQVLHRQAKDKELWLYKMWKGLAGQSIYVQLQTLFKQMGATVSQ